MTSKTAAEHDDSEPGITAYPVCDVEGLAKAIIRQAPDKAHRWAMWESFTKALAGAREVSAEYPWDDPAEVTAVTPESARHVLLAMFEVIPDNAERDRLAKVAAKEAKILEDRLEAGISDVDVPAGRLPLRHCQACGQRYRPRRESSRYCGQNCRQQAFRLRRKAD